MKIPTSVGIILIVVTTIAGILIALATSTELKSGMESFKEGKVVEEWIAPGNVADTNIPRVLGVVTIPRTRARRRAPTPPPPASILTNHLSLLTI